LAEGDANGSMSVDAIDLAIWQGNYGHGLTSVFTPNFDGDSDVDGADFLIWQRGFGTGTTLAEGDANGSMTIDATDLALWQAAFGQPVVSAVAAVQAVPEPTTWGMILVGAISLMASTGRQKVFNLCIC